MFNQTLFNQTISTANYAINVTSNYISNELYPRGVDIVFAPIKIPEMLWMLIPLLVSLVLMECYFGRYKEEELGWNTAFGNALVLTFVAIDLFRHNYEPEKITILEAIQSPDTKISIAVVIFSFAILLLLIDFFHFLPKKWAYAISSGSFIHMISILGIIIVYTPELTLDWTTFLASFLIFLIANGILHILYLLIPSYKPPLQRIIDLNDINKKSDNK